MLNGVMKVQTVNVACEVPFDFCNKCPFLKAVESNIVYVSDEIVSRKYTCANQALCYWVRSQIRRRIDVWRDER